MIEVFAMLAVGGVLWLWCYATNKAAEEPSPFLPVVATFPLWFPFLFYVIYMLVTESP